jgi:UDP-glucose 4-epimerase
MKKVIVFGGSGFLGSYVADELTERNYDVVIADINESLYLRPEQSFVHCDILDQNAVMEAIRGAPIVYNFAGLADLNDSISRPHETLEQNVMGNINILEACRKNETERFVYASSAYALSAKGSFYGISKFASEKIVEEYATRFNLDFCVLRYGSIYGERADKHNGLYRLLKTALTTGEIRHKGNGEEVREYIHAVDAATLSVDVIEDAKFHNQHLMLTGVERLKYKDLLRMIQEILNDEVKVSLSLDEQEGHYQVTPYSFQPNAGWKLTANPFIELGQGLVNCMKTIHDDITQEKTPS